MYRHARPKSSPFSPHVPLAEWHRFFSALYQSHVEPIFPIIPVVPTQEAAGLLESFSTNEILASIQHQQSSAKGINGISPLELRHIAHEIAPLLVPIYNNFVTNLVPFPEGWSSTIFFLIHKKGPFSIPSNYRSIAIEDPLLKIFTTSLYFRLSTFVECNKLLPDFQFGFRQNHSTTAAASLLKHCIELSLNQKRRVYACFVDFKKAFDLIDRTILCQKLQLLGIPSSFVKVIFIILQNLRLQIRSNDSFSEPFASHNGVPQGDPLSPLLFSLFIADLSAAFTHCGIRIETDALVNHILYADDLVILSDSPEKLQRAINRLSLYCTKNKITVNVEKTKCMIFYKGYHTPVSFHYQGQKLEVVNSFTYLGIVFTTRLSSTKHVDHIISKCQAKIGLLHSQLPLKNIPLSVCIDVFNTYILPVITYALPVWFPNVIESSCNKLNAVFTKFLKLCLGLPYNTNNAITYYLTNQTPVCETLKIKYEKAFYKVKFPEVLSGLQLTPPTDYSKDDLFSPLPSIPSYFWLSQPIVGHLPHLHEPRRALLYDSIDIHHFHLCTRDDFHLAPEETCVCRLCLQCADHWFHYRECPHLKHLSPCARYRKALSRF